MDYENKSLIIEENLLCLSLRKEEDKLLCSANEARKRPTIDSIWLAFGNLILLTFLRIQFQHFFLVQHSETIFFSETSDKVKFPLRYWQISFCWQFQEIRDLFFLINLVLWSQISSLVPTLLFAGVKIILLLLILTWALRLRQSIGSAYRLRTMIYD